MNGVTAVAYRYMELKETLLSMAVDVASGMVSCLLQPADLYIVQVNKILCANYSYL